jgi:multicomponent Na+:H+ antiporter subunit E
MVRRVVALYIWAAAAWLLLTWTVTFEQLVTGGVVALVVAVGLCAFDEVAAPWRLLDPRVLFAAVRLVLSALARIVTANVELTYRIWAPSRPLRSGMLIVPTAMRTDGGVGGTGLITSLIVDNQITDLDRDRQELQYHAVAVPEGDRGERAKSVNGPVERLLAPIVRGGRT